MTASVAPPGWADLPLDLLGHISDCLCDAAHFVRFHAVCRSWRDTAALTPAAATRRPWILARCNGIILQYPYVNLEATTPKLGCNRRCYHNDLADPPGTSSTKDGDRNWVASTDGKAIWLFTGGSEQKLTDLLTGAVTPLPPFPRNDDIKKVMEKPRGIVYGDGTILLYTSSPRLTHYGHRPIHCGHLTSWRHDMDCCAKEIACDGSYCFGATYHRDAGRLLLWIGVQCYVLTLNTTCSVCNSNDITSGEYTRQKMLDMNGSKFVCDNNYYMLPHGELLWACVLVEREWYRSSNNEDPPPHAVSLTVYALKQVDNRMEWVEKEGRSLSDRVLFLGSPTSFTVDVAQLGVSGGYAYFVFKRWVYSYNLVDGQTKLVTGQERLSLHWGADKIFMWLLPQPTIAPIQEIRERLKASCEKDGVY